MWVSHTPRKQVRSAVPYVGRYSTSTHLNSILGNLLRKQVRSAVPYVGRYSTSTHLNSILGNLLRKQVRSAVPYVGRMPPENMGNRAPRERMGRGLPQKSCIFLTHFNTEIRRRWTF